MSELHNAVEFDNLSYHYKGPNKDIDFIKYNDAKRLFDIIKNKDTSLSNAGENQECLKSEIPDIKIGG